MGVFQRSSWLLLLLGISLLATTLQGVQGEVEPEGPSESECRPYIEKALKELETGEPGTIDDENDSKQDDTAEVTTDDSDHTDDDKADDSNETHEQQTEEDAPEQGEDDSDNEQKEEEDTSKETQDDDDNADDNDTKEDTNETGENKSEEGSVEVAQETPETEDKSESKEGSEEKPQEESVSKEETEKQDEEPSVESAETPEPETEEEQKEESVETLEETKDEPSKEKDDEEQKDEQNDTKSGSEEDKKDDSQEQDGSSNKSGEEEEEATKSEEIGEETQETGDANRESSGEDGGAVDETPGSEEDKATSGGENESAETPEGTEESVEESKEDDEEGDSAPEEELSLDIEIPTELRDRTYVEHLLKLDEEASETEQIINRVAEITLKELKKLYENAIKPLEVLYKYRDLSNRHFGDAEIFSKPLILFMGPWSGGKSSIINYLLNNEFNSTSLRTGAEPSPAYFNILMHGDEAEIWDGAQLAADFTFSGLQKFGQGLEERLRGVRLPSKLLERVNIVEIPGILEVRKQVSRVFPFNDACQWFIDRADIIFLVYDPSKLDVGPETEAILDQLKGREHQTRIILNKADQVKSEELMRVQGALIWNISPLMSSPQPPVMYTTSLWSRPYEPWAPARLLQAQERSFLRDLRSAVDKRIENKIASARRFAVRVRNHAKMVDCYLTTYYNHKSVFGNRKQVADEIIEHPQDYHIYEGLSTLTNISRYDLPDPDVYRDFFKLNPLYEFQQLSATCTYFRGCPINRLDIAIAYDLPELIGKHKRLVESALAEANDTAEPSS